MKSYKNLLRSKNRITVCVLAFILSAAMTGYDIMASVDNNHDLPEVQSLDDDRPIDLWKAPLSRYHSISLTRYSIVGGKIGKDVNPFAYRPLEGDGGTINRDPMAGGYPLPSEPHDKTEMNVSEQDTPESTPEAPAFSHNRFVFTSYGSGSGLGLSKNGADCYAKYEGMEYTDILAHYYPGTYIMDTENYEEEIITVGDVSGTLLEVLPMVLYSEMSDGVRSEALKAMAVALYSYIEYNGGSVSDLNTKADPPQKIKDAVSAVVGEALYYDGDIAMTLFSESSGGCTSSYNDIYGEDIPYLTSVPCEYDAEYDPDYGISTEIYEDDVRKAIEENLGITLSDDPVNWIKITEGDGGYAADAEIDGRISIKGTELMDILGLRSAKFTFEYKP